MAEVKLIGDLTEGSSVLIEESDGNYGEYYLVHLNYNDNVALLWRSSPINQQIAWNTTSTSADVYTYQNSMLYYFLESSWFIG